MCVAIAILSIAFYLTSPIDARTRKSYDRRLINNGGKSGGGASANQGKSFQTLLGGVGVKKQRQSVTAEESEDSNELCSCSPRSYDFHLNFNADCDNTLADNEGIDGDICFFADGGTPEEPSSADVPGFPGADLLPPGEDNPAIPETNETTENKVFKLFRPSDDGRRRRDLRSGNDRNIRNKLTRLLEEIPYELHQSHATKVQRQRERQLRVLDTTPLVITSVTFVEFDTKIEEIIQQDSTYFETEKYDGDTISFTSLTSTLDTDKPLSEQLDLLPGGVMLLMFGINADNVLVQNTAAWGYKLDYCDGESLRTGDAIGWMSLASDTPPWAAFCPGVTDMPTANPSTTPTTAAVPVGSKSGKKAAGCAKESSAKSSKQGSDSRCDEDDKFSKSAKVFNTTSKATKLFKQKADKNNGIADEGANIDDSKAGKLMKTVPSAKSAKSSAADTKSSKAKLGTVQISRPQVPRPEVPSIPIASPTTNPPLPLGATSHPTSETSQINESVLLAMTAPPTVVTSSPTVPTAGTNSIVDTSPGKEENV